MSSVDEKKRAFFAMIPTQESFTQFIKDMHSIKNDDDKSIANDVIEQLAEYACEAGIIKEPTLAALEQAFDLLPPRTLSVNVPENVTFNDILEDIQAKSMNQLLEKLNLTAEEFRLPNISATMISRLRKEFLPDTAGKRCVLRVLAFWMAKYRPQLAWNYEQLFALPRSGEKTAKTEKPKEGVVIALNIQIKGDIVRDEMIDCVTAELQQCLEDLRLFHLNKRMVETHGAKVSLRIPKRSGLANEPRLYNQAIRDALALAHQMAVRWLLSDYSSPQKLLAVAIHAGDFANANLQIQPILETRLPGESSIFLTEFAYLCARLAEVKVGFAQISMPNEVIWSVKYFWSHIYYDFIPDLLEDDFLPTTQKRYEQFQLELYNVAQEFEKPFKALLKMHLFPQNTLLLIEIAKTLLSRRMYYEADNVLSYVLRLEPYHIIARTMRMTIHGALALEYPDFFVAEIALQRAINESQFIITYCDKDEEFWCELGMVYYNKAEQYWSFLRRQKAEYRDHIAEQHVFDMLKKARQAFLEGISISANGKDNRCLFWQLYTEILLNVLQTDRDLFDKKKQANFFDRYNMFQQFGIKFFRFLGWTGLPYDISEESYNTNAMTLTNREANILLNSLLNVIGIYENSVSSRSYTPNIKYAFCCLIWDFSPLLTKRACRQLLTWLTEIINEAERLLQNPTIIYSSVNALLYQSPKDFIECMKITIKTIKQHTSEADLQQIDDDAPLPPEKLAEISKIKLMYLHIDRDIEHGVLVREEG